MISRSKIVMRYESYCFDSEILDDRVEVTTHPEHSPAELFEKFRLFLLAIGYQVDPGEWVPEDESFHTPAGLPEHEDNPDETIEYETQREPVSLSQSPRQMGLTE